MYHGPAMSGAAPPDDAWLHDYRARPSLAKYVEAEKKKDAEAKARVIAARPSTPPPRAPAAVDIPAPPRVPNLASRKRATPSSPPTARALRARPNSLGPESPSALVAAVAAEGPKSTSSAAAGPESSVPSSLLDTSASAAVAEAAEESRGTKRKPSPTARDASARKKLRDAASAVLRVPSTLFGPHAASADATLPTHKPDKWFDDMKRLYPKRHKVDAVTRAEIEAVLKALHPSHKSLTDRREPLPRHETRTVAVVFAVVQRLKAQFAQFGWVLALQEIGGNPDWLLEVEGYMQEERGEVDGVLPKTEDEKASFKAYLTLNATESAGIISAFNLWTTGAPVADSEDVMRVAFMALYTLKTIAKLCWQHWRIEGKDEGEKAAAQPPQTTAAQARASRSEAATAARTAVAAPRRSKAATAARTAVAAPTAANRPKTTAAAAAVVRVPLTMFAPALDSKAPVAVRAPLTVSAPQTDAAVESTRASAAVRAKATAPAAATAAAVHVPSTMFGSSTSTRGLESLAAAAHAAPLAGASARTSAASRGRAPPLEGPIPYLNTEVSRSRGGHGDSKALVLAGRRDPPPAAAAPRGDSDSDDGDFSDGMGALAGAAAAAQRGKDGRTASAAESKRGDWLQLHEIPVASLLGRLAQIIRVVRRPDNPKKASADLLIWLSDLVLAAHVLRYNVRKYYRVAGPHLHSEPVLASVRDLSLQVAREWTEASAVLHKDDTELGAGHLRRMGLTADDPTFARVLKVESTESAVKTTSIEKINAARRPDGADITDKDLQAAAVEVTMANLLTPTVDLLQQRVKTAAEPALKAALAAADRIVLRFQGDKNRKQIHTATIKSKQCVYLLTHVVFATHSWGTRVNGISPLDLNTDAGIANGKAVAAVLERWLPDLTTDKREIGNREIAVEVAICTAILWLNNPDVVSAAAIRRCEEYAKVIYISGGRAERHHEWTSKKPRVKGPHKIAIYMRYVPPGQQEIYTDYHANYLCVLFLLIMRRCLQKGLPRAP